MAGRNRVEAEPQSTVEKAPELQVPVALDARIGCPSERMGFDVGRDHLLLELLGEVEDVVIYPQAGAATRRASSTSPTEQHPESPAPPQSFMVAATTS